MRSVARLGLFVVLAAGCAPAAPGPSGPTAARAAAGPLASCERAARQRSRVAGLLRDGRLDRAIRVIANADELCPATARESAAARVRTLAELGRNADVRVAADAIERDPSATPAARAAAADARAAVERPAPESGRELLLAARRAKDEGAAAEAQRLFDRAAALLELEAGAVLASDVPAGYGPEGGLPWAGNGVIGERDARTGPAPAAFSWNGRELAVADGTRVAIVELPSLRERALLRGHGGDVTALAFGEDDQRLASAALDETARVWSPDSGKGLATVKIGGAPRAVWLAKNGAVLACATAREVSGWEIAKGTPFARFGATRGADALEPVDVSPGGLVAFAGAPGVADLFSLVERERVAGIGAPEAVALSPDGSRIATAEGRSIRVLGAPRITLERSIDAAGLTRLSFSPDGALLAGEDGKGSVRVWDAKTGASLRTLAAGDARVLAVTADGKVILRGPRTLRLLDARSGAELRASSFEDGRVPRAASPDGKVLLGPGRTSANAFELWDAASGRSLGALGEPGTLAPDALAVAPDSAALAVAGGGRARLVGLRTGDVTTLAKGAGDVTRLRYLRGGAELLGWGERALTIWDVKSGRIVRDLDEDKGARRVRAVDGPGAFAVVEDWEGFLWGWDVAADRSIHKLGPGPHPCDLGFVLSPDAKTFACAKDDGTVSVWAPSTGALLRSFGQAQGAPRRLAFLPDGRTLAVALADGKTSFWDVERGAASRAAIDTSLDAIELLVPAAGELLVLGRGPSEGGAVRLYALAKDLPPRSWPDRLDGLTDATLSPSGQVLAVAASRQRAIGLWRVADAEPLAVVRLLADGSAAWATTPDGAIEAFGDPAVVEARAVCRLAASTLPFDVCRDRFVTRGLVRGLLANNDAWRDP